MPEEMSACQRPKKDHFWQRCCKKLADNGRHHSIRRWKNVREPRLSLTPVAMDYRSAVMSKSRERAIQAEHTQQRPTGSSRPKRTVSGATTAPELASGLTKSSLSPQTFTTAETSLGLQEHCKERDSEYDAPRPTLDPRSSYSFRTSMKSSRFHKKLLEDCNSEPSFTFGFTARNESNSSFFSSSGSETSSLSDRGSGTRSSGEKDSASLDNMVKSFDWYATSAFKKLETSVLSLLNLRGEYDTAESTADLTVSPFSGFYEYGLTPCTGAATKWEQDIDEAIYGHHAKCFI